MLTGLLIGQLADAATFAVGLALHGIGLESNGFASLAYRWQGVDGVLLLKGGALPITLAALVASATPFPPAVHMGRGRRYRPGTAGHGGQRHLAGAALPGFRVLSESRHMPACSTAARI